MRCLISVKGMLRDETALCSKCDTETNRQHIENEAEEAIPNSWTLFFSNDARLICAICGIKESIGYLALCFTDGGYIWYFEVCVDATPQEIADEARRQDHEEPDYIWLIRNGDSAPVMERQLVHDEDYV